ncbi:sporulation protein YunB [Hydrogenibacillus sp. N12]|uniref:sporulation protein YunB n=1 Tax=Hydrogenibacillus sp. N12 TaxID=2866627 RepID=UPI001C7DF0B4|nr:sporulation protein YunB [Hydrogenibacillus sp. N12]QZA32727.1 sporulation protein YunB [Hydrogenibacillus sp. N12]
MARPTAFRRRFRRRSIFFLVFTAALVLFVQGFYLIERRMMPIIRSYAEVRVVQIAEQAIMQAIRSRLDEMPNGRDLLIKTIDPNRGVIAISLDAGGAARVQALAEESMRRTLGTLSRQRIDVPLGVALGSEVLANTGPRIPVTIVPIGAAEVELEPAVEETGINNVLLTLYLKIKLRMRVIIPFASNEKTIEQRIAVAQELIVGQVPLYYFKNGAPSPIPVLPPPDLRPSGAGAGSPSAGAPSGPSSGAAPDRPPTPAAPR